tara:strand:+ start:83 stop:499 length:417 start_codon:yes stop_codon:yes gene_type:complete
MFCGIGRNKSKDCKKPPKIYKHPSTSPITVKEKADKKSSRASISPITVPRSKSDKIYDEAVKNLDVQSKSSKLADELGLLTVGKIPGKARGLPAYEPRTTKKAGKRRRKKRKTRKTRKRRKTKRKRRRKRKRKSKRRK